MYLLLEGSHLTSPLTPEALYFGWLIHSLQTGSPKYYEIFEKLSDEPLHYIPTSGQLEKRYVLLDVFCKYNVKPVTTTKNYYRS